MRKQPQKLEWRGITLYRQKEASYTTWVGESNTGTYVVRVIKKADNYECWFVVDGTSLGDFYNTDYRAGLDEAMNKHISDLQYRIDKIKKDFSG